MTIKISVDPDQLDSSADLGLHTFQNNSFNFEMDIHIACLLV